MIKICVICEKEFTPIKANEKKALCCSNKCNTKRWRQNNPDRNKQIASDWRRSKGIPVVKSKEHRYKMSLISRKDSAKTKRNIRIKSTIGWHSKVEWEELKAKYNYTCMCCKKKEPDVKIARDHIIPLCKGGSNDISNIQPLCKSCNSKKHQKVINYICQ